MGAAFKAKVVIKRKSLPTRPINVKIQAVPESDDVPVMGSSGGGAKPSTPAGGLGLPSSPRKEKSYVRTPSGKRGSYK